MTKERELSKYYHRMRFCCCFLESQVIPYASYSIEEKVYLFNQVLDGKHQIPFEAQYSITIGEVKEFIEIYKRYRDWLIQKYLNPYFSFSSKFRRLRKPDKKLGYDPKPFKDLYGEEYGLVYFLAESFNEYLKDKIEWKEYESIVLCKMQLGVKSMLHLARMNNYEQEIVYIKANIDHLKEGKGMTGDDFTFTLVEY